ncbi:MAG: RDD family protein [Pirellulaceae bacterium]
METNPYQAPANTDAFPADFTEQAVGEPGICQLCGVFQGSKKPQQLYGQPVCRKCYYKFINRRQASYILDSVFWNVAIGVANMGLGIALVASNLQDSFVGTVASFFGWIMLPVFLVKDGFSGYSPGKLICGVRVIDRESGRPLGFVASLMRNVPLIIPIVPLIIAFQLNKGYRWGDRWARSKVIWNKYADRPVFARELIQSE